MSLCRVPNVSVEHGEVDATGHAGGEECLDLRRKDEAPPALLDVEKRLFAEPIPRAEKLAGRIVPDGECEHSVEIRESRGANEGKVIEHHLGVRMAVVPNALAQVGLAKLLVVVDFPVVHNAVATVERQHRLTPLLGQVEHRQAPAAEPERTVLAEPPPLARAGQSREWISGRFCPRSLMPTGVGGYRL